MKKIFYSLIAFFVCAATSLNAYEYFTIYYSDGTKSEAFYATDVDSICYSKIGLDSLEYNDWHVQEIYTCDSVYRIPISNIDHIDFTDVDESKVAEDIVHISKNISPIFTKCHSTDEIANYLPEIARIEGVEDVWTDIQTLFVKVRNWGTLSFLYVPQKINNEQSKMLPHRAKANVSSNYNYASPEPQSYISACLVAQPLYDQNFAYAANIIDELDNSLNSMGISSLPLLTPYPEFFSDDIFKYDIIFLLTHGEYNEKENSHWLFTGEELLISGKEDEEAMIKAISELFKRYPMFSPNMIGIGSNIEKRNDEECEVFYVKISENYILSSPKRFGSNGKAIIFNAACQSMMKNDNLSQIFLNKGAGCYLGYTQVNNVGAEAGKQFFDGLLNAQSVVGAYQCIDENKRLQHLRDAKGRKFDSELQPLPMNQLRILYPQTLEVEEFDESARLLGCIKMKNSQTIADSYKYGFLLADNPDMNQVETLEAEGEYDTTSFTMNFESNIDAQDLKPSTTYYYQAYMYDGFGYCYGEVRKFKNTSEPYYVWDSKDKTATYYYDTMREERGGTLISEVYPPKESITVIFDSSFVYYHPRWCTFSNCRALQTIKNLNYLNTNQLTSMAGMFFACESLVNLDLSSFNTAKVTDMGKMFVGCHSLTNLNLRGFNTTNVTDMSYMFQSCTSLSDLDLSSFNTVNVTNMEWMFALCKSLVSLDLSNFNTSNVTNMSRMFDECTALTNLDISKFSVLKETDMSFMFCRCQSLTDLHLSKVNISNVTNMEYMFSECESLEFLDLSNFSTSNVTNMEGMFLCCKSLKNINFQNFSTSKVTNMGDMFDGCLSLTSIDLYNFNTSKVRDMFGMFAGCRSLSNIDLSNFNTSNVTSMESMFEGCQSLTSLDISHFNTSSVTNLNYMFNGCSFLGTIYGNNWNLSDNVCSEDMFVGCDSLAGGKGTKIGDNLYGYESNGNPLYYNCPSDARAAHIDGGKDNPGLFTAK